MGQDVNSINIFSLNIDIKTSAPGRIDVVQFSLVIIPQLLSRMW